MIDKSIHDLEKLLAKIEGVEGQHERSQAIKAEIERLKTEEGS